MRSLHRVRSGLAMIGLATLLIGGAARAGQFPWIFTYQGRITQSGTPMNGTVDLAFKLFDSAAGGNQAGPTITATGVPVTDGRFTIDLDFTNGGVVPGTFDGYDRYLEITANGTLLTPREHILPTPYAIFARHLSFPSEQETTAPMAINIVSDSDVGQERVIHSVTNSTKVGAIAISGEALGGGNNENVGVAGHSLSANGFGVAGTNSSTTGNCSGVYGISESNAGAGVLGFNSSAAGATKGVYGKVLSADGYGGYFEGRGYFRDAVGIGLDSPQAKLHIGGPVSPTGLALNVEDRFFVGSGSDFVGINRTGPVTSAEFFGIQAPVTGNNYGGMYVQTGSATGKPFYGYALSGSTVRAWTYFDGATNLWSLYAGSGVRLTVDAVSGNLGVKRTPTVNDLEVEGTASKTAAGSWLANSDARIKTDVSTITDALDTLDRVRLVSFRYADFYQKDHPSLGNRRYMNVIAQEFREVFPDAVKGSGEKLPNGDEILQVDTYPLTIYSAAAVQELHRMITERDARLAEQGKLLADLSERLSKLESTAGAASEAKASLEK